MAVSLAHMSQEASRRRATTLPSRTLPPSYSPGDIPFGSSLPDQCDLAAAVRTNERYSTVPSYPASNQPWVGIPEAPMSCTREQRYVYQPGTEHAQAAQPARYPVQQGSPTEPHLGDRPALPPRPYEKAQQPPSPHDSVHSSSSSAGSAPSWRTSIEPDPLPPHSNPQALSATQAAAFTASERIPDVSLGEDEIWNTTTGLAEFRISRQGPHLPRKLSSRPLLTVTRTSNGQTVGSVKLHTFTSSNIELSLPSGRSTSITHSGFLHSRWGFQTLSSTNTWDRWYWKKDHSTGGAVLENARHTHGEVVARISGDTLSFVRPRLRAEEYDEVVLSAVAMVEATRRKRGKGGVFDLGAAVGEMAGTDVGA